MGKLRVYCLKTLNKLPIYPLGNTPSAPSEDNYWLLPYRRYGSQHPHKSSTKRQGQTLHCSPRTPQGLRGSVGIPWHRRHSHTGSMLRLQILKESRCNWKQRGNIQITGFRQIAIDYPATRTAGNYLDQRSRPRRPESGMDSGGVLQMIVEAKSRVEQR